ncbi:MAG: hypothetical protein U5J95_08050 [Balneolaceae bacterium]|nr:hypothetical protein [Balneolaceae bacterium]
MHSLKVIFFLSVLLAWSAGDIFGQDSNNAGVEVQAYPAGIIIGSRGGISFSNQQEVNARFGYNFTDRRDFGKHDNEEGGGLGFGAGYRYYFGKKLAGFFAGARSDLWFLKIDWVDTRTICGTVPPCFEMDVKGRTDIIVLQPTVEIGYDILKSNPAWILAPTLSFGAEINIKTKGEEVGEGAILLGGLNVNYRF